MNWFLNLGRILGESEAVSVCSHFVKAPLLNLSVVLASRKTSLANYLITLLNRPRVTELESIAAFCTGLIPTALLSGSEERQVCLSCSLTYFLLNENTFEPRETHLIKENLWSVQQWALVMFGTENMHNRSWSGVERVKKSLWN